MQEDPRQIPVPNRRRPTGAPLFRTSEMSRAGRVPVCFRIEAFSRVIPDGPDWGSPVTTLLWADGPRMPVKLDTSRWNLSRPRELGHILALATLRVRRCSGRSDIQLLQRGRQRRSRPRRQDRPAGASDRRNSGPSAERLWALKSCLGARLEATRGDSEGTGAHAEVQVCGETQPGSVRNGSSCLSRNDPRLHFVLGGCSEPGRARVGWTDDHHQTLEGAAMKQWAAVRESPAGSHWLQGSSEDGRNTDAAGRIKFGRRCLGQQAMFGPATVVVPSHQRLGLHPLRPAPPLEITWAGNRAGQARPFCCIVSTRLAAGIRGKRSKAPCATRSAPVGQ